MLFPKPPLASALAPSLDDIEAIARSAWAAAPSVFRELAGDLVLRVEEFADDSVLDDLEIEDPLELTGLYVGENLIDRSITSPAPAPHVMFLYRLPILNEWADRGDVTLEELVAHVLVHEVGHHFGFSDDDMDAILDAAD